jgi:probable rRNA maturation factor
MIAAATVSADGVRLPLPRALAEAAIATVLRGERARRAVVSVTFVSNRAIAALNRQHLGHTGATDVISFPLLAPDGGILGDVYIAPDVARANARTAGVPVREELVRLVVHGTLHVLGWDHPDGEERLQSPMWRRQEQLVRRILQRGPV